MITSSPDRFIMLGFIFYLHSYTCACLSVCVCVFVCRRIFYFTLRTGQRLMYVQNDWFRSVASAIAASDFTITYMMRSISGRQTFLHTTANSVNVANFDLKKNCLKLNLVSLRVCPDFVIEANRKISLSAVQKGQHSCSQPDLNKNQWSSAFLKMVPGSSLTSSI